jgi:predicted TIM-barrel fold metal-dependent hydrolase
VRSIVDSHHHLWDLDAHAYPWYSETPEDRGWGDMSALMQDYLVTHLRQDAEEAGWSIKKSVHVQANFDPTRPVVETQWLQSIADAEGPNGLPTAIVAWCNLLGPDCADVLAGHSQFSRTRGVRQVLNRHPDPKFNRAPVDFLNDEKWLENFGLLGSYGFSFDAQIYAHQWEDLMRLAKRYPETPIILDHALMPEDHSPQGMALWRKAIGELSQQPNLTIKLSGFGMVNNQWTVESIRPIVEHCVSSFGSARAMFGSNFPVDKLMAGWGKLWGAYAELAARYSAEEQNDLFCATAERVYRI